MSWPDRSELGDPATARGLCGSWPANTQRNSQEGIRRVENSSPNTMRNSI